MFKPGIFGNPPAPPCGVYVCTAVTFTLREKAANLSMYERVASTVARRPLATNSVTPPVNMRVTSTTDALSLPYASTFSAVIIGKMPINDMARLPERVLSVATLL